MDISASIVRTNWPDDRSGLGVVVAGGFVITAAHCVPEQHWSAGISDDLLNATNSRGQTTNLRPISVDLCHDLAILTLPEDAPDDWMTGIPPLPVQWWGTWESGQTQGRLFTHDRGLVRVAIDVPVAFVEMPNVSFTAEGPILGGTSGGPCLTEDGRLLATVSFSGDGDPNDRCGYGPWIAKSLPRWIAARIRMAERET